MNTDSSRAASIATVAGLANVLIGSYCIAKVADGGSYSVGVMGWVLVLFGAFALATGLLSLGFRQTYGEGASILGVAALVIAVVPYAVLVLVLA